MFGHQYFESKTLVLQFLLSANLSIVNGPHTLFKYLNSVLVVFQFLEVINFAESVCNCVLFSRNPLNIKFYRTRHSWSYMLSASFCKCCLLLPDDTIIDAA